MNMGHQLEITTKVTKEQILTALHKYLEKHIVDYKEATENYWKSLTTDLEDRLAGAKNRVERNDRYSYSRPIPVNMEKMYQQYIEMFSISQNETFDLSMADYDYIFNDNWQWIVQAKTTNSTYSNASVGSSWR